MAGKNKILLQKFKKISYLIVLGLSAIAIITITKVYSQSLFPTQTQVPNSWMENTVNSPMISFPLGWIDRIERQATPSTVSQEGMNILIPYTHNKNQQTIKNYLDVAYKHNMKVFLEPYRKSVDAGDLNAVAQFVRTYKNHPAVAGWYAYDEPVRKKHTPVSPQLLEAVYQTIKAEDPIHPISLVFPAFQLEPIASYKNAFDICLVDRYPLFHNKPEFDNLGNFRRWMYDAATACSDRPFWPVLQGFGEQQNGQPKYERRLPTALESRYMFYTSILGGANGVIYYGHHWTQQAWIDSVLTPIIREFLNYVDIITANTWRQEIVTNNPQVEAVAYQKPSGNGYLVIAINHSKTKAKATFDSTNLSASNSIKVLGEKRNVKVSQQFFQDEFNFYGVHIYNIQ